MSQIERKKFFVNSLAQGQLLLRFSGYWVVYHVVLWHTLFMFRFFQYRFDIMMGEPPQTFYELYGSFCIQYYPIVFSALAVLPLLLWDMVKMTHRIVGPLVRFQRTLEALQRGERIEKVTLRDHDLLIEYRDAFNQFLVHYNQLVDRQQASAAAADGQSQNSGEFTAPSELELHAQIEELSSSVAQFNAAQESAV